MAKAKGENFGEILPIYSPFNYSAKPKGYGRLCALFKIQARSNRNLTALKKATPKFSLKSSRESINYVKLRISPNRAH
jgi:hypothetical protein